MNEDLLVIQRIGYTILDLLSDIGGISSIFSTTFTIMLSVWNYLYFDSYLASKLYKLKYP